MGESEPAFSIDLSASWCEVFHREKTRWGRIFSSVSPAASVSTAAPAYVAASVKCIFCVGSSDRFLTCEKCRMLLRYGLRLIGALAASAENLQLNIGTGWESFLLRLLRCHNRSAGGGCPWDREFCCRLNRFFAPFVCRKFPERLMYRLGSRGRAHGPVFRIKH